MDERSAGIFLRFTFTIVGCVQCMSCCWVPEQWWYLSKIGDWNGSEQFDIKSFGFFDMNLNVSEYNYIESDTVASSYVKIMLILLFLCGFPSIPWNTWYLCWLLCRLCVRFKWLYNYKRRTKNHSAIYIEEITIV